MAAMTCGRLCLPASAATTCAAAPRVPRAAQQQGLGACEAARCALPGAPVERARSARTAQTATSIFVDTCRQTSSQELFFFINSCARGQGIACVKRRTRLVVVHARAGGSVWPLEDGRHVVLHAREAVVADLRRAAAAAPHCVRAARKARRGRLHADRRGIKRCIAPRPRGRCMCLARFRTAASQYGARQPGSSCCFWHAECRSTGSAWIRRPAERTRQEASACNARPPTCTAHGARARCEPGSPASSGARRGAAGAPRAALGQVRVLEDALQQVVRHLRAAGGSVPCGCPRASCRLRALGMHHPRSLPPQHPGRPAGAVGPGRRTQPRCRRGLARGDTHRQARAGMQGRDHQRGPQAPRRAPR